MMGVLCLALESPKLGYITMKSVETCLLYYH